jgi:hypothetical protein
MIPKRFDLWIEVDNGYLVILSDKKLKHILRAQATRAKWNGVKQGENAMKKNLK